MGSQTGASGLAAELSGALAGARGLLSNFLDLFTLEARRAGLTLVLMLTCGAIGAILVVAAWLGLMAALAIWGVGLGMSLEVSFTALAMANLAAAGALLWLCGRFSRDLLFPATRRQLRSVPLEQS